MKRNSCKYSGIRSFEDFRKEKEMLHLRGKIVDTKLSLAFLHLKQNFSPSNLISSLAREFIMPGIAKFLRGYQGKNSDETET
jgi:hypothetical protein